MKRRYTFAVYITAEDMSADEDAGFTRDEVQNLLKTTLSWYSAPLNKNHRDIEVDFELMSEEPPRETFEQMDARIAADVRRDEQDHD